MQVLDIFNDVEPFQYIEKLIYGDGLIFSTPDEMVKIYSSPVITTYPGDAILNFQDRFNDNKIPCYYKYEDYLKDSDLQETIERFDLNPDFFWLLIMFSYDYVYDVCFNGHCYPESLGTQINSLISLLNQDPVITVKSQKKKLLINNVSLISKLKEWIQAGYKAEKEKLDKELPIDSIDELFIEKEESNSVMIWLFATLLKFFLDRHITTKKRRTKEEGISLNKLQLISILIYQTRLSRNKNFLYGDEALKGFLKQYKNKQIKTYSPIYH